MPTGVVLISSVPAAALRRERADGPAGRAGDCGRLLGASRADGDDRAFSGAGEGSGARGAASAQDRDPRAREAEAASQRCEQAGDVGVPAEPAAIAADQGVDGARGARRCIRLASRKHLGLEGDGDARATQVERIGEVEQVRGIERFERHVDGVQTRGAERGVVHHRRHRVTRRPRGDAVERDAIGDLAEPESVAEPRRRDLSRAHASPAYVHAEPNRPGAMRVTSPGAPIASRTCLPTAGRASAASRATSRRPCAVMASLVTAAPVAQIARWRSARSAGTPSKSCADTIRRSPRVASTHGRALEGRKLNVDVLGAHGPGFVQQPQPRLLASAEVPAFPARAAGDDHRACPSGQRAGDIRVGDHVEAQLHQVGVASRLSRRSRRSASVGAPMVTHNWAIKYESLLHRCGEEAWSCNTLLVGVVGC